MDLKSALKDILPRLTIKAKKRPGFKWAIDRPVEFHECSCGEMVDERIMDICIITSSDEFVRDLWKDYGDWHKIHNSLTVKTLLPRVQPCFNCFRWTVGHHMCWSCSHNPWSEVPPPMIRKRPWYVAPKESHAPGL